MCTTIVNIATFETPSRVVCADENRVQRFNARRPCCNKQQHRPYVPAAAPGSGVMGAEDGKQLKSSRGGGQEGDGGKIDVLRPEVWEGDFGE